MTTNMGIYSNPDEMLREYNNALDMVRRHRRGEYKGKALEGSHWENVARQRAVKFGNLYKKTMGVRPLGFDEVLKRG